MRPYTLTPLLVAALALPATAEAPFQFSGQLFLQNAWQTSPNGRLKSNSDRGYNGFDLTRSYLTAQSTLAPGLSARLTSDLVRGSNGDTSMIVRFAYTQADTNYGQLRFGLIPSLWTSYESNYWGYRLQGEPLSTREGWFSLSDLGTTLSNKTGAFSYDFGYYNGEGRLQEADEYKQYQAKLTYNPIKNVDVTAFYSGVPSLTNGKRVTMGLLGYKVPELTLALQQAWTRDANFNDGAATSLFATTLLNPQFEGIARWMHVKPNFTTTANDKNVYIAGVAYKPSKGYTLLLDNEMTVYVDSRRGLDNVLGIHTGYTF